MSTKPVAKQVVPGANGAESATADEGAIRPRDSLFHWCGTVDAIQETKQGPERRALLEAYFAAVAEETVAPAARFFLGDFFPRHQARTVRIGSSVVLDAMQDFTRINPARLHARYVAQGDLGEVAAEVFAGRLPSGLAVIEVAAWGDRLANATTPGSQRDLLLRMLARVNSLEARYIVKLIGGDLRIGLDQAQVDDALAKARISVASTRRSSRRPLPVRERRRRRRDV